MSTGTTCGMLSQGIETPPCTITDTEGWDLGLLLQPGDVLSTSDPNLFGRTPWGLPVLFDCESVKECCSFIAQLVD